MGTLAMHGKISHKCQDCRYIYIYIYIYIHIHSQCCARHGDRPGGEGGLAGELLPAALPVPGNDNINNHNTRNLPIPGTTSRVREDFPAMG